MPNKKITKCRICGSKSLVPIASFGNQYLTNFPKKIDKTLSRCPLNLVWCKDCKLLQLEHTPNFDYLYQEYWYVSGVNQTMRDDLKDVVKSAEKLVPLKERDIVLDIGSNDSTLLRFYTNPDIVRVGFEPAKNLMEMAQGGDIPLKIINNFFNYQDFENSFGAMKVKVITAIAMFYDLDEPNIFVADMVKCLDENGLIIIQLNYLPIMLDTNTFDNVSHEHLEYYCLMSMENLLNRHGLEIFDIELNDVNGGSLRAYIKRKDCDTIEPFAGAKYRVRTLREYEKGIKLDKVKPYRDFAKRTIKLRKKIYDFIAGEKQKGKIIYVYGASTRGNALLQACDLDAKTITAAAERNPMKYGRFMVGSWIPIVSEAVARKEKPDYFLALPWQFKKEFIEREKEFLKGRGKFIFIFPKFEIYEKK